ncbi:MAG: ATPase [Peptococcaceae bacterium]|jgi:Cdc6-like AAA superfamily ATPase|nr:ATPase [Peptococcaceae bacterium]
MQGSIKRVFPGGNTSEGFFSYYQYLLEKGTKRVFVIKGGPGVGKSTLMKKVGKKMLELGYDVELHHCSSDDHSLDGIAIIPAGIVMVDGTAPHIIDPKYPGGLDEIINMGDYWNVEAMQLNSTKIVATTNEVSRLFARAYRFLAAARSIAEDIIAMHKQCMDFAGANRILALFERILAESTYSTESLDTNGHERHLFSSAYTPNGFIDFTDTILQDIQQIYYLHGPMGSGKTTLLRKIADRAIEKGLDVEIYHTPLIPAKIGTVLIPALNLGVTSSEKFKTVHYETLDLSKYLNSTKLAAYQADIESDKQLLQELINSGIENIRRAKEEHDILEQYYVPNMDFSAAEDKYEEIMDRILSLAASEVRTTAANARIYN